MGDGDRSASGDPVPARRGAGEAEAEGSRPTAVPTGKGTSSSNAAPEAFDVASDGHGAGPGTPSPARDSADSLLDAPAIAAGPPLVRQAHLLCLWGNVVLAVLKLGAGFSLASPALIADGWHSAADTLSSVIALVGYRMGREPADEDHHFGHGNHEALAGLLIGIGLAIGGAVLLWDSLAGSGELLGTGGVELAMIVALVSTLFNLAMAAVTHKAAKSVSSLSLRALMLDNLGDALSSLIVMVAIGMRSVGFPQVELYVAAAIGVVIAAMGLTSVRKTLDVLLVRVADTTLRTRIAETARAQSGVRGVQDVCIHPLGSELRVDLEINVDGNLTVAQGHDIAHAVEDALKAAFTQVHGAHVHVNPCLGASDGANISGPFADLRSSTEPQA